MCGSCKCLYVNDLTSSLYTIDPVTASARLVGPCGMASVTDIAFHGSTLYGISFSQFLRLNPDTGHATVIGPIGGSFSTNGLAVASDGIIYASTNGGQLISINPVTGAGTAVGNFGGGLTSSGDLAFDCNDVLYGVLNQGGSVVLAQINRTTGVATVIGPTGQTASTGVYGLGFFCCHLYGTTSTGQLLTINAVSGASTVIAKNSIFQGGLAVRPCCGC
jgi:hypothetical protein